MRLLVFHLSVDDIEPEPMADALICLLVELLEQFAALAPLQPAIVDDIQDEGHFCLSCFDVLDVFQDTLSHDGFGDDVPPVLLLEILVGLVLVAGLQVLLRKQEVVDVVYLVVLYPQFSQV